MSGSGLLERYDTFATDANAVLLIDRDADEKFGRHRKLKAPARCFAGGEVAVIGASAKRTDA
jgi:hypothetical protein